jgi:hypothetical protein
VHGAADSKLALVAVVLDQGGVSGLIDSFYP